MTHSVHEIYGNRLRVRACGLCVMDETVLMVNHRLPGADNLWIPPGGGVSFGESTFDCLIRELKEETGLVVKPQEFLFATEFIASPLHAIELFFKVEKTGGTLKMGTDPETTDQIIKEIRFIPWRELKSLNPKILHGIFQKVAEPSKIMDLRGYFKL